MVTVYGRVVSSVASVNTCLTISVTDSLANLVALVTFLPSFVTNASLKSSGTVVPPF